MTRESAPFGKEMSEGVDCWGWTGFLPERPETIPWLVNKEMEVVMGKAGGSVRMGSEQ